MRIRYLCVFALYSTAVFGQATTPPNKSKTQPSERDSIPAAPLPVEKVILYKNGVGYFEHIGKVAGNQDLGIAFTTAQLNDVLKSLTLVDLNGGRISDVRYNSVAPLEEQLKSLQIPLGEDVTSSSFLTALRGTRVEVRSVKGGAIGKLFSVESVEVKGAKGETKSVTQLAIVTDAGEMRVFELAPDVTVRTAEGEIHKDVNRYLDLLGTTRSKDLRRMTIHASGTGDRRIFVSYISEVPVWKSTYRIVIPAAPGKPFLQGWAIIDNTVGEDWKNVKLTLVSGTPQSFIQNISQPYYTRRPVVPVPQAMMLTPQAHEATLTTYTSPALNGRTGAGGGVGAGAGGGIAGGVPGVMGKVGSVSETVEVNAYVAPLETSTAEILEKQSSEAEAAFVGDLFEYGLKERITVLKNQSALVPIVQSPIELEKVTLVTAPEDNDQLGMPLRALWVHNTSGQTLDGGTFNILEQDSFAGEGVMEVLHPDERRLLSYAADRAIHAKKEDEDDARTTTRVNIVKGVMAIHQERRSVTAYVIRNADTSVRQIIVEHPIREGWHLAKDLKPEEAGATHYRFRVPVEPGKSEKLVVEEFSPEISRVYLSTLTDPQITAFIETRVISASIADTLRKVSSKKLEISRVDDDLRSKQQDLDAIAADQSRLRENMKALKGSAEEKALLQRYTKQLDEQEDRLAALKKEMSTLKVHKQQLNNELNTMIEGITLDESM